MNFTKKINDSDKKEMNKQILSLNDCD